MITDRQLYMMAKSPKTIGEANAILEENNITNLNITKEQYSATVEDYETAIDFDNGKMIHFSCSCNECSYPSGACRHTIALAKKANELIASCRKESLKMDKISNEIFDSFTHETFSETINKQHLMLIKNLDLSGKQPKLFFKIGINKTYIVKDIMELIDAFKYENELEYSDTFTLNPYYQQLSPVDYNLIEMIEEIAEIMPGAIYTRYISLNNIYLKKFLKIMAGKKINIRLDSEVLECIEIMQEKFNNPISIAYENGAVILDLKLIHAIRPLTEDYEYIYFNRYIYHLSSNEVQALKPFINAAKNEIYALPFRGSKLEEFITKVVPCLPNSLELPDQLQSVIIQFPLKAKLYLDKENQSIVATPVFKYGFYEFNAMENPDVIMLDDKYLIRQLNKEEQLMNLFDLANFKVGKNNLYIDNQEDVLSFVNDYLPILQENMEVFYSDSFKTIIKHKSLNYKMKFNEETQLFDITFNYDDVLKGDFKNILRGYKLKQKYYRLSDGSFISLDDENTKKVIHTLNYLNLKVDDLTKPKLSINKSQALLLNTQIDLSHTDAYFQDLVNCINKREIIEFKKLPAVKAKLRDYQVVGYEWFKTLNYYQFGGILADDMGLGKTLQTLTFILDESKHNVLPNLVVCPSSLIYNWEEEIKKFTPELKYLIVSGSQTIRKNLISEAAHYQLIITSYPLLRNDINLYSEIEFNHFILDEAQNIKNPNSLNSKSVKQIKALTRFALTGTPIENSLTELWSIFDFLMPGMLLNRHAFRENYEKPIMLDHNAQVTRLLNNRIRPFILRRMKSEVLTELPEKIEKKYIVDLTDKQKLLYLDLLAKTRKELSQEFKQFGYEKSQMKVISAITRLRQLCNHPSLFIENYTGGSGKLEALQDILDEALLSHQKVLIFSQFVSMLNIIKERLELSEIPYYFLDGNTPSKERLEFVNAFNNDDTPIFLISLKAGGTGLNLTGASIVIHVDPWWNPAVENQATDRAYRIGQKQNVQVIKLISKGTIEEKIYDLQNQKKELTDAVIQPGETFINKLTEEELMNLLL